MSFYSTKIRAKNSLGFFALIFKTSFILPQFASSRREICRSENLGALFFRIFTKSHKDRSYLSSRSLCLRRENGGARAGYDSPGVSPLHGFQSITADFAAVRITGQVRLSAHIKSLLLCETVQHHRKLFAADRVGRSEPLFAVSADDAVETRPVDRCAVPAFRIHIGVRVAPVSSSISGEPARR